LSVVPGFDQFQAQDSSGPGKREAWGTPAGESNEAGESEVMFPKQKSLQQRALEKAEYLFQLWKETGVCCPCCGDRGVIHPHRAVCAICGQAFHYDPFRNDVHQPIPRDRGLTAGYWKDRPKTFLKGDTENNGERGQQRSFGFI